MLSLYFMFQSCLCLASSFSFSHCVVYLMLQLEGRTLPLETICLQSSSFTTGADVSWSREVTRDASISSVSTREKVLTLPQYFLVNIIYHNAYCELF